MKIPAEDQMVEGVEYAEGIEREDLIERLLPWQVRGLQYAASGYGGKIPTRYIVKFKGRERRVYAVCWSNAASFYVVAGGRKLFLRDI